VGSSLKNGQSEVLSYRDIYQTNLQRLLEGDELPRNYGLPINIESMTTNYNYCAIIAKDRICISRHLLRRHHSSCNAGKFSKVIYEKFETPSTLKFKGHLKYTPSGSIISLDIPPVSNNTKNSMIHIVVKGSELCEGCSKVSENLQAELRVNNDAWQAAEFSIRERLYQDA